MNAGYSELFLQLEDHALRNFEMRSSLDFVVTEISESFSQ